jgi:hypothetical protein
MVAIGMGMGCREIAQQGSASDYDNILMLQTDMSTMILNPNRVAAHRRLLPRDHCDCMPLRLRVTRVQPGSYAVTGKFYTSGFHFSSAEPGL